ncbi:hypothetical protein [Deinococcus hopiensis]|uniref:hypothetical protein n=1 Tax=Deinococcus hopiensis TaxID=309885 RepID=UPI001482E3C5|nr:hypothetical protein [Deinococcus hopiensis]
MSQARDMSGRCWAGRTGAFLIAWDAVQYQRDLCRVSPTYRAARGTWGGLA